MDWDALIYVAAVIGAVTTLVVTPILAFKGVAWVRRLLSPSPPDVTLLGPGASMSQVFEELEDGSTRRRWTKVEPSYYIDYYGHGNIYDVSTGVRTRDGLKEHRFAAWYSLVKAGVRQPVNIKESIPEDWLRDIAHENPERDFIYFIRYRDEARKWWETWMEPPDPVAKHKRLWRHKPPPRF